MRIKLTSVYVDDQEKALRFYTDVLGFVKKADFSQGPYRWLTVAPREEPDGTELQLALNKHGARSTWVPGCRSPLLTRPRSRPTADQRWPKICPSRCS